MSTEHTEPAGLSDEELLRVYGLAKRDHNYEGPLDDWPKRAERAATVAGLRAVEAATLARAQRQPEPGEVQELVGLIRQIALAWEPDATLLGNMTAGQLARAADLLESLSPPQPVPVSERLPGPEDCDAEGRCWLRRKYQPGGPTWWLARPASIGTEALRVYYAEWLPAHDLPLPGEVVG